MTSSSPYLSHAVTWRWWARITDTTTGAATSLSADGAPSDGALVDGSLDWQQSRPIRDTGSLTIHMSPERARATNWARSLVQVGLDMLAPEQISHTLGTWIPTVSATSLLGRVAVCRVDLHGRVSTLEQDRTTNALSLSAGTVITNALAELLASTTQVALTPSEAQLSAARTWSTGTSVLQLANDLCEAAGYARLWTDPHGVIRAEPAREPGSRDPVFEFTDGPEGLYTRAWEITEDLWDIPNRLVATSRSSGAPVPLRVVAEDTTGPLGHNARGRWITQTYEADATTTAKLDEAARKELAIRQVPSASLRFQHGYAPVSEGDAVRFVNQAAGVDAVWLVESRRMNIGSALVNAELRRVPR